MGKTLEVRMNILKAAALIVFAAASAALPLTASAQQPAVTAPHHVQVRAGPDGVYPVVAVLPPRAEVTVFGCLSGYSWCDVGFGIDRGWIHSSNLRYYYQNRYVPIAGVATIVGIGLTAFVFNDYWGRHYREQRFYAPDDHWHRGPPPRAWGAPQTSGYAPGYGPNRPPGFAPSHGPAYAPNHGQMPNRPMAQPSPQGQLAPTRPNGGQPGMHPPQSQNMQPAPQAAMQQPAHGAMPPRPVPQGNAQANPQGNPQGNPQAHPQGQPQAQPQRAKGDVIHNDRKHGNGDEQKH